MISMDELPLQIKQEEIVLEDLILPSSIPAKDREINSETEECNRKAIVENSQCSNIGNILPTDSESKLIIKEENFEVNEFSDDNFVGVHEAKNEKFEQLDIKSESLQSECEYGIDPLHVSVNSEKKIEKDKKQVFRCEYCIETFQRREQFTKHNAFFHEGYKPFKCNSCDSR
jgi:hypothetical protein